MHDDYQRIVSDIKYFNNIICPICSLSKRTSSLQDKVSKYLEDELNLKVLHEYECNCIPINNNTKMPMPFDNEIVNYKLIIEVHGIQHYKLTGWHITQSKASGKTPKEEFEYQKWKDLYKKEYAENNGYHYLEIPYYYENDDLYKKVIDDKIVQIKNP